MRHGSARRRGGVVTVDTAGPGTKNQGPMRAPTKADLDHVLTVQLAAAWAGEGACGPPRLGWWRTDLVDADGGGDFMRRLAPRTFAWAGLEAVREAARRADAAARLGAASPDDLRSLFLLGPDLDEHLDERLADLKRAGDTPPRALPGLPDFEAPFDRDAFAAHLTTSAPSVHDVTPLGRAVTVDLTAGWPQAVDRLAAALVPFADRYSAPYFLETR